MDSSMQIGSRPFYITPVTNNLEVADNHSNWNVLAFREALAIKKRQSIFNNGLKASKDLQLF